MFDRLVDGISAALWNLTPHEAVRLGKHEYDGVVPELDGSTVTAQLDRLRMLGDRLGSLEGLSSDQELDRLHVTAAVATELVTREEIGSWRHDPAHPIEHLDLTPYAAGDYAPVAHRAEQAATVLDQAGRLLDQARAGFEPPIPRLRCRRAIRLAQRTAGSLQRPPTWTGDDQTATTRLAEAAAKASEALLGYADWVETELLPAAVEDCAIGPDRLEALLRRGDLVDLGPAGLLATAREDLDARREDLGEAAARIDPESSPAEVYTQHVAPGDPDAGDPVRAVREEMEAARSFVVAHGLVTIPDGGPVSVAGAPVPLGDLVTMYSPGPYEAEGAAASCFVASAAPAGGAVPRAESGTGSTFAVRSRVVHTIYPGHHLHSLHRRRAPSDVSKRMVSRTFWEGWAHYAEQLMAESDYGVADARIRLARLRRALVCACRLVCALRLHCGEMVFDEAAHFFVENAACSGAEARVEAERVSIDPGCFADAFGKLQILRLRCDYRTARGASFDQGEFHDRLLSRGAPPVELMRKVLMGP